MLTSSLFQQAYLLSTDAQYINGQSMAVGAGLENYMHPPNQFRASLGKAFAEMQAAAQAAAKQEL